jgi:hypothetical protein
LKCCHGYQTHHATDCPNNFLDGHTYKEITEEILLAYNHLRNTASGNKMVGAVMSTSSNVEEMEEDGELYVAGAVMPSAVLGSSSETEEEVSPLTVSHLCWACMLMGPGAGEPVSVMGMLDCGAHVVLIDSWLVDQLRLCHFCLHKPLPISVMVALNSSAMSESQLYE